MSDSVLPVPPVAPQPPAPSVSRPPPAPPAPEASRTGRTQLALVSQRIVADQTAVPGWNNREVLIKTIELSVAVLFATLQATIHPLVHGNYRSIGTRTNTAAADIAFLDQVTYTISANAVAAAYAVLFHKARATNNGYVQLFGGLPEVDKFKYPAFTTLLINSLGPIQRDRDPYICLFLPWMAKNAVDALRNNAAYLPRHEELFITGMQRTRNVLLTDVDVGNVDSSPWWCLYIKRNPTTAGTPNPGATTVLNPISYDDRDTATILGGLVLTATLYELPGPCHTAEIGPFVGPPGNDWNAIPNPFRRDVVINGSPRAIDFVFTDLGPVTHAAASIFGTLQGDLTLANAADPTLSNIQANLTNLHNSWLAHLQSIQAPQPTSSSIVDPNAAKPKRARTETPPGQSHCPDMNDNVPGLIHLHIRKVTVIYFDHRLYDNVSTARQGNVITEANRMNVSTGD
uniref:Uncharacterized protein n=1 Tax=viral metagenome TaxID=1070528 RepID=A0A2V0RJT4_9ZZZZ